MNTGPQENNPVRILVVDDSMLMRTILQETLLEAGFQVLLAADGMDAWGILQKEPIDLIMADANMPRLDGLELTRMIRAHKRLRTLPIILISATDASEDRRLGMAYGANAFITKEKRDLEWLAARITRLLRPGTTES